MGGGPLRHRDNERGEKRGNRHYGKEGGKLVVTPAGNDTRKGKGGRNAGSLREGQFKVVGVRDR